MSSRIDWVLLDRLADAINLRLPLPAVPVDDRGAYAAALLERGISPTKTAAALGIATRDLPDPIGVSA